MFFTHNMQYSLLLLIHVKVQCDLAITKFTCVNVCSLNCLDLFLKYKFGLVCVCVCVCVFGIHVLKNYCWEMILKVQNVVWIFGWVACFIAFISVFFPSWKTVFKLSWHLLNTSQHLAFLLRSSADFYRNLDTSR